MTAPKPLRSARETVSRVSVSVPTWLTLTRMAFCRALCDAAPEPRRAGDKEIVAHQPDARAQRLGERGPARPVVLGEAVLDRGDGIARHEILVVGDHPAGIQGAALAGEPVGALPVELARRAASSARCTSSPGL